MTSHAARARRWQIGLPDLPAVTDSQGHLTCGNFGVSDGIRTRDIQDHNLALCQLSYAHHCCRTTAERALSQQDIARLPEV